MPETQFAEGTPLSILIVDDDQMEREAAHRDLKSSGLPVEIREADGTRAAMELLRRYRFDCVVLDHSLPDNGSLNLLREMRNEAIFTPVVVLTGSGEEVVPVDLMKAGAADYLTRRRATPETLARSVRNAVRLNRAERTALRAEVSLRASEERLHLLLENVREYAIVGLSPEGTILDWNIGAERVFGFPPEEVVGRHFSLLFTSEDVAADVPAKELEEAIRTGSALDERWHMRRQTIPFFGSGITTALRDDTGALRGFIKLVRDETERKVAEEALRQANSELEAARLRAEQASQAKSEFLANLTHELRTPLNIVLNLSEFIEERIEDKVEADVVDDLRKIRLAGNHLLNLINDLLDIARIEANRMGLHPETFQVRDLVRETVDMAEPLVVHNGNRLSARLEEPLGTIHADRQRMRQILLNLLSNAAKFTEHGDVVVHARREASEGRDWIVVAVSDTGIGISPAQMEKLFDKFHQGDASPRRRHGGAGLGLALSKLLAEMMGGTISARSEPGKGSTFTVRLPAEE